MMRLLFLYGAFVDFSLLVAGFSTNVARKKTIVPQRGPTRYDSNTKLCGVGNAQTGVSRRGVAEKSVLSLASLFLAGGATLRTKQVEESSSLLADDENWQGTSLQLLSLDDAVGLSTQNSGNSEIFPFAQWPDPILRRPASRLALPPPNQLDSSDLLTKLQAVARTLQHTAHKKGAVGLAAQQCGIDLSFVYLNLQTNKHLQSNKQQSKKVEDLFLLNPRIVRRSPEVDMRVWTEECLVLPPFFRATLLRDATVTVEYDTIFGSSQGNTPPFSQKLITLDGELARAVQHEMDHDLGRLILDHVGLDELPPYMRDHEREGHDDRMDQAFGRDVASTSLLAMHSTKPASIQLQERSASLQELIVPRASAAPILEANSECDEKCLAERKRIIEERRAMMRQSRTNTRREDVFELSKQRAKMYNTTYQGAQCPQAYNGVTVPCI